MVAVARFHDVGDLIVRESAGAVLKLLHHLIVGENVAVREVCHAGVVGFRHPLVEPRHHRLAVGFERAQLLERRLGLLADFGFLFVRHVGAVVVLREEEDMLASDIVVVVRPREDVRLGELLAVRAVGILHDGVERGVAPEEQAVGRLVEIRALHGLHQRVHAAVLLHDAVPLRFDLGVHRLRETALVRLGRRNGVILHARLKRFAHRVLQRRAVARVGGKVGDRHGVADELARHAGDEIVAELPCDFRTVHRGDDGVAVVLFAGRVELFHDLRIRFLRCRGSVGCSVRCGFGCGVGCSFGCGFGRAGRGAVAGRAVVGGERRNGERAEQQHKAHKQREQFLCFHSFFTPFPRRAPPPVFAVCSTLPQGRALPEWVSRRVGA